MDEKTVPLPKASLGSKKLQDHPVSKWGQDFNYRSLFEQTGECVFIIGLDLRYITANQQALDLLGYEEHELVGMPVSELMSLDEKLDDESIIDSGSNLSERILKRKDGSTLPVEISTTIVYDEKHEPAYIQSIARDISERKSAEQILRKQTRILSVIGDATARLLRFSEIETGIPEVLESLGKAMDVFSCTIFEINTFSSKPSVEVKYLWQKHPSPGMDVSTMVEPFISEILNSSDSLFSTPAIKNPSMDSSGHSFIAVPIHGTLGLWGFLGLFDAPNHLPRLSSELEALKTAADLIGAALQRDRYEDAIRLSEARNRVIIEALPDLLIRIDKQGYIQDYSTSPENPLYIHRDVISGKRLAAIWPEEVVEKIIGPENLQTFTGSHRLEGFHLPFSNNTYESRLHPIGPSEALILIRDVTEQERLNEAKSDFINRASHELRTPLTSAILMSELIQGGGEPEELKEYWQILNSELNRQKILIDRLLIAGRLESGMMKLDHVPLDLVSILQESMLAVKPIANKREISLKLTTARDPITVVGDKSGLQQVFINLINNATKFSPEGETVEIDLTRTEGQARTVISDHGLGIPPEALSHLFERFYRAKNVTIAEIPGSGIGLYIVKSIVEELGGTISVESVLNQGTTFTVCLKLAEGAD